MRIIAGAYRGRQLLAVPGCGTRPITDRVKESLFNILGTRVVGMAVLDIFCGSGSLGLEALSRGAEWAAFVDSAPKAIEALRQNIERLRVTERSRVYRQDAFRLGRWARTDVGGGYGLVFVDPPYAMTRGPAGPKNVRRLLNRLVSHSLLAPEAYVVVRHEADVNLKDVVEAFEVEDERRYGRMGLTIFRRAGENLK